MASLLETSVLWIQLINSNIPQEYLNDVKNVYFLLIKNV